MLCCFFRGKCCVTLLNETEALKSYLDREVSVTACRGVSTHVQMLLFAWICFSLSVHSMSARGKCLSDVCVWELVWVPIQMNNSVCWPSMFLLIFSNEETGDSTKSQAGPLISQTLAFTGSFICVYIKGQEHTLHLSLVTALQACCTWCAFLSLMQRCTKLSLAFVYFNAVCFWP